MFWNIYGKRIRGTLRDKDALIWTWIFPIMLSTLFYFAFSSLDKEYTLSSIPTAVVMDEAYEADAMFQEVIGAVSGEGEESLLAVTFVNTVEEADTLLEIGEVEGYIQAGEVPRLILKENGLNQTILKSFLDQYIQKYSSIETIHREDPDHMEAVTALLQQESFTEEVSLTGNPPSNVVGYYYALLAMVCMYGGFQGMRTVSKLQANLSPVGARQTMSPAGRFRLVIYDLLGGITVHFGCVILVLAYMTLILGVNFGSKTGAMVLTCLVGSLMGVAFGALVCVSSRLKESAKTAVLTSVTMCCCFMGGLMVGGMNYIIAQNLPVLSWLNPAARIVDSFYCLYYYNDYGRYLLNIGILGAMAVVMFFITGIFIRRQRYESI